MNPTHPIVRITPETRHLAYVIAQIQAIAPDLHDVLESTRTSALYAAPEAMRIWWEKAATILNTEAPSHDKRDEIAAIFAGTSPDKPTQVPEDASPFAKDVPFANRPKCEPLASRATSAHELAAREIVEYFTSPHEMSDKGYMSHCCNTAMTILARHFPVAPNVLGHPATAEWCASVDAHHKVTEDRIVTLERQLAEKVKPSADAETQALELALEVTTLKEPLRPTDVSAVLLPVLAALHERVRVAELDQDPELLTDFHEMTKAFVDRGKEITALEAQLAIAQRERDEAKEMVGKTVEQLFNENQLLRAAADQLAAALETCQQLPTHQAFDSARVTSALAHHRALAGKTEGQP